MRPKQIRILIESGHERNRNAGDEAYFAAMVTLFRKHLGGIELTTFSDRPHRDRERYGIRAVYSGGSLVKSFLSVGKIIGAIRTCDIYLWGAGQILRDDTHIQALAGSILNDKYQVGVIAPDQFIIGGGQYFDMLGILRLSTSLPHIALRLHLGGQQTA